MDNVKYILHQIDVALRCKKYPLHTEGCCQYFEKSQTWDWHPTWTVSGAKLNAHNQTAQIIICTLVLVLDKNRDQMWALVKTVIKCQVP
jgi:hypothetical protein